jgi:hypothetical protein
MMQTSVVDLCQTSSMKKLSECNFHKSYGETLKFGQVDALYQLYAVLQLTIFHSM